MNWQSLPERGSRFWILLIIRITRWLGRPVARLLLYPISAYFLLVNNQTRRASREFFSRVTGRPACLRDSFRQFHTFAAILIDRLTILTGDLSPFEISFQGLEHLESAHQSRKGAVLVGSHFGSFDVLRTFSHGLRQYPVRAIMYGQSTPTLLSILGAINPKLHEEIRVVPGPAALISLVPELNKGAMIGLLGDRILPGERHAWFDFLGSPAPFPLTPALVADVLEVPLIQFICRHKGFGRYEVQFYVLGDGPSGPRCERTERIRRHTLAYVQHLEHHVRAAPHNWFNFHDFWSSPQ